MKNRLHPIVRFTWLATFLLTSCNLKTEVKTPSPALLDYYDHIRNATSTATVDAPPIGPAMKTSQAIQTQRVEQMWPEVTPTP